MVNSNLQLAGSRRWVGFFARTKKQNWLLKEKQVIENSRNSTDNESGRLQRKLGKITASVLGFGSG